MMFVINSIFTGTWSITMALLVIQLFRRKLQINPTIIRSVSILLLIGASIYLLKLLVGIVENAYLTGEHENQWVVKGSSRGYLIFLGVWPFSFGLLPQLLWLKKLRGRLSSLAIIIAIWAISRLFVPWGVTEFFMQKPVDLNFKFEFSFVDQLEQIAVYATAFALVCYLISWKENRGENLSSALNEAD